MEFPKFQKFPYRVGEYVTVVNPSGSFSGKITKIRGQWLTMEGNPVLTIPSHPLATHSRTFNIHAIISIYGIIPNNGTDPYCPYPPVHEDDPDPI